MENETKRVDTRGEPLALAFKDIGASHDGKWARIVFLAQDRKTEIPIQLAADLLAKMLPSLLNVDAECERRRTGKNVRKVYQIKKGQIQHTESDSIVFDFIISTGQHYAFEVDRMGATLIRDSLSAILVSAASQTGAVGPPLCQ